MNRHTMVQSVSRRTGVTLSEVLIALLVMSIGVIAIATLFPISVLRAIQATQLTQATQLRFNAESMMSVRPELLYGVPAWTAGTTHILGDMVVPRSLSSNSFFVCTTPGTSDDREPGWNSKVSNTTSDGSIVWTARQARVYMIDPLGWEDRSAEMVTYGSAPSTTADDLRNTFGRGNATDAWPPPWRGALTTDSPYRIVRFRGVLPHNMLQPLAESTAVFQRQREQLARGVAVMPDSFELHADSTDLDTASFTQDANGRLTAVVIRDLPFKLGDSIPLQSGTGLRPTLVDSRITLFDQTGRFSQTRMIDTIDDDVINSQRVAFTPTPLDWSKPTFLGAGSPFIGRVRIETREYRFSWMLAVRRSPSGTANCSVVCFFKRSADGENEIIHPAHFSRTLPGNDGSYGTLDDVTDNNRVVVQFNAAATEKPFLKRGGYICDAQNNRWYRITSYRDVADAQAAQQALDPTFAGGELTATIGAELTLEHPIFESSGLYSPVKPPDPPAPGGAILMPGVINVYPLDPK